MWPIFNNKIVRFIVIVVIVLAVLWLACVVLEKLGAHFSVGGGVGSSGAEVHLGGT